MERARATWHPAFLLDAGVFPDEMWRLRPSERERINEWLRRLNQEAKRGA